jgi:hypothetical protein
MKLWRIVGDVTGELTQVERLLVRAPLEFRGRRPLEEPSRRPHFVVELGQERIFDGHAKEYDVPAAPRNSSPT